WPVLYHHLSVVRRMPEKPKHDPLKTVTESPISDVFEGRHPTTSEKEWAEKTLAPTLEKAHSTSLYASRSPRRLELRSIPRLSRPAALHTRHSLHRLPRQTLDDAH